MYSRLRCPLALLILLSVMAALGPKPASANIPGGGTGAGPNVTVTDNGNGTVTMANGIASIVIVKKSARVNAVYYTYNNSGTPVTKQVLGGSGWYYGGFPLGDQTYNYRLVTNPADNGGNYADISLLSDSPTNGIMDAHFAMLRGSSGFYIATTLTHRSTDAKSSIGAWGTIMRVASNFNWLSQSPTINFLTGVPTTLQLPVVNSPHEATLNANGTLQGEYEDKFIYGEDHADLTAWGWSSVGQGGSNIGIWTIGNLEYEDGGPLKHDCFAYPSDGLCLNYQILTGELGQGGDGHFDAGEVWSKTEGPWFIYLNDVKNTITDTNQAAQTLYDDAQAQAVAEHGAWPYAWYTNPNYVHKSGRGTVTGMLAIKDSGDPNASAANIWVGVEQQPLSSSHSSDFQTWLKAYQYWAKTDAGGKFRIPNVIAGTNYTLWAFGGAPGTFLSQNQAGGNPPLVCDLPKKPFAVVVKAGETNNLGTVTWTPTRVGATVFEMGYPDRKADKFRHGEDYWSPGKPAKLGYPTPVWGGQMEFPVDFPNGMTYTVGHSRWTTDWNYVLPSLPDAAGAYQPCTGTITFNLAHPPAEKSTASIYLGCAGDDGGHVIVSVNGKDLAAAAGVVAVPNAFNNTGAGRRNDKSNGGGGFNPSYSDDSSIHFNNHGPFSDERINFPGSLLHAGQNTLTVTMNAKGLTAYLMVDYLRLELTGYVPPAPAGVTASVGNGRALVRWPLVPGASSYSVLRSTTPGGPSVTIAAGRVGPVCGSGPSTMNYTDTTAANGRRYYYLVQSVNPIGHSGASPRSSGVTPSSALSSNPPAPPTGLKVTASGHHNVTLSWKASPGSDNYTVWRSTLYDNRAGSSIDLRTIVLDNSVTHTSYTDTTPTDGRKYGYYVTATSAGGTSRSSSLVSAVPLPTPPMSAPGSLVGRWTDAKKGSAITLTWTPVPGASGYVIYRSTHPDGPFKWPDNFVIAICETTYADQNTKRIGKNINVGLDPSVDYFYRVTAVNAGGISPPATVHMPAK